MKRTYLMLLMAVLTCLFSSFIHALHFDYATVNDLFESTLFTQQTLDKEGIHSVAISLRTSSPTSTHMKDIFLYERGFGYVDPVEKSIAVSANETIFLLAEASSVITVHAFMKLLSDGQYESILRNVTLDTPVNDLLELLRSPLEIENELAGKWSGFPRKAAKAITLRHILTQTAGFDGQKRSNKDYVAKQTQVASNLQSFLVHTEAPRVWPVESFSIFDDFNICLLAYIIELVTETSFVEYANSTLGPSITRDLYYQYSTDLINKPNFAYPIASGKRMNLPLFSNTAPSNGMFSTASALSNFGSLALNQSGVMRMPIQNQFSNYQSSPANITDSNGFAWYRTKYIDGSNELDYSYMQGQYGPYLSRIVIFPDYDVSFSLLSVGMSRDFASNVISTVIDRLILNTTTSHVKTVLIADIPDLKGKQNVGCYVNATYEHTTPATFFQMESQNAYCISAQKKYLVADLYKARTRSSSTIFAQLDPVNKPGIWYEGKLLPGGKSAQFQIDQFWAFRKTSAGHKFLFLSSREETVYELSKMYSWFSVKIFAYVFIGFEALFGLCALAMFIFIAWELFSNRTAFNFKQSDLFNFLIDPQDDDDDVRTQDYLDNIYLGDIDSFEVEIEYEQEKPKNFLSAALQRFKPEKPASKKQKSGISRKSNKVHKVKSKGRVVQNALITMVIQVMLGLNVALHLVHIVGMLGRVHWMLYLPYFAFALYPLMILAIPLYILARSRMGSTYFSAVGLMTIVIYVVSIVTNVVYIVFVFRLHWLSTKVTLGVSVK